MSDCPLVAEGTVVYLDCKNSGKDKSVVEGCLGSVVVRIYGKFRGDRF